MNTKYSISANLIERYVFNFRITPDALERKLPVKWLTPQLVNGYSIVSFCILRVRNLVLNPIPSIFGLDTICCAYRCGVIDMSGDRPDPSVYILGRNTNNSMIAKFAPSIFCSNMPKINTSIKHALNSTDIDARHFDNTKIFTANVKKTKNLNSKLFATVDEFSWFIKNGVSSYTPSNKENQFVRIDLCKDDRGYEPLDAIIMHNDLNHTWLDTEIVFDSAVKATGGLYKWTYKGLFIN